MRLKKLIVKNFKSLKECEVELGKFNVLIGPNASGKTNLVEVFKLLRKIYVDHDTNPFLEWWGYNNVVWAGKEELPITVGMLFDVEGYDVYFETTFIGTGGSFQILKEVIEVKDYLKIEKQGKLLSVSYSPTWFDKALKKLPPHVENRLFDKISLQFHDNEYMLPERCADFTVLDICTSMEGIYSQDKNVAYSLCYPCQVHMFTFPLMSPSIVLQENTRVPLHFEVPIRLRQLFSTVLTLRQILIKTTKTPQYPRKETTLSEDASNLIPLLYNIWLREGRLPEEIAEPLSIAFPNTRVFFQLTEDGRVMMKVFENDLELAPPGISDGFYKVLAILTAAYLKHPLLIIDEIENSLHPETLELIIDTLRESESQVIITTHSPVVVDIVEPSDLVLVDKENGETVFKRIKDPEKIKKFLNEKGITLSEGWLYGSLFENDEQ